MRLRFACLGLLAALLLGPSVLGPSARGEDPQASHDLGALKLAGHTGRAYWKEGPQDGELFVEAQWPIGEGQTDIDASSVDAWFLTAGGQSVAPKEKPAAGKLPSSAMNGVQVVRAKWVFPTAGGRPVALVVAADGEPTAFRAPKPAAASPAAGTPPAGPTAPDPSGPGPHRIK